MTPSVRLPVPHPSRSGAAAATPCALAIAPIEAAAVPVNTSRLVSIVLLLSLFQPVSATDDGHHKAAFYELSNGLLDEVGDGRGRFVPALGRFCCQISQNALPIAFEEYFERGRVNARFQADSRQASENGRAHHILPREVGKCLIDAVAVHEFECVLEELVTTPRFQKIGRVEQPQ